MGDAVTPKTGVKKRRKSKKSPNTGYYNFPLRDNANYGYHLD